MNTKSIKALMLSALFTGALAITSCDTGTKPGEANVERSDIKEEGSMNEGYTSDEYPAAQDTTNLEDKYYNDAEGAVHAGDGKTDGVDRGDVDKKQE